MVALGIEFLVIFVLLIINGVFAMSEVALLSSRRARLQSLVLQDKRAAAVLDLLEEPNNFLSSVQVGVTLVGVLSGAYGGATLAEEIAERLDNTPALAAYAETIGVGIVVLLITFLSLVIGELVPKRLALSNPERVAMAVVRPMGWVSHLVAPLVALLSVSTNAVLAVLRLRETREQPVTRAEVKVLLQQGAKAGTFRASEQAMVEGVFRFAERRVNEIMTPRYRITWIDLQDPWEETIRKVTSSGFASLPVGDGLLDNVIGVLRANDALGAYGSGNAPDLRAIARKALNVHESTPAIELLELFRTNPAHLALVLDEFGAVEGLVTPSDILRTIVGDLPVPHRAAHAPLQHRPDGALIADGSLPWRDVLEVLKIPDTEQGSARYQSLAGFVLAMTGQIPIPGDRVEWNGYQFDVVEMDRYRIAKVLIKKASPPETQG